MLAAMTVDRMDAEAALDGSPAPNAGCTARFE